MGAQLAFSDTAASRTAGPGRAFFSTARLSGPDGRKQKKLQAPALAHKDAAGRVNKAELQ